ncbi:hypothetical protein GCM10023116_17850 [Kistimonas scapharcae]|uniref:PA14 domain-containing protein n=2 Tax=Kistimonas scapharcae TaxID=1036133 RepID=A0ABP8V0S4_9GAMM
MRFLLQALEPRVLLDAAGLATLADTSPSPVEHHDINLTDTDYLEVVDRLLRSVAETKAPEIADAGSSSRKMQEDATTPLVIDGISVSHPVAEEVLSLTIRVADNNPKVDPGSLDRILTLGDSTDVTVTPNADGLTLVGTSAALNHALTGMTILPAGHFNGTMTLTFQATDDSGDSSDPLAVDIMVRPVNDPVTISDDIHLSAQEGGTVTFAADQFGLRDPDIDTGDQLLQQMTVRIDSLPLEGQLTFKGNRMVVGTTFSYDQLDKLVYTHNGQDVSAGETDQFRVTVFDGAGTSDDGDVIIDLQPKNLPPAISVGDNTLFEGQGKDLGLSLQDSEISHADAPENVQVSVTGVSAGLASEGRLFLDNDGDGVFGAGDTELTVGSMFTADLLGKVAYEHNGGETGNNGDLSFTLAVTDAGGGTGDAGKLTATQTIELDILPVDDDPVLVTNHPITVTPCSATRIDRDHLRSEDIDNRPSELVYTLESSPVYGLVVVNIGGTPKEVSVGARFTQKQIDEGEVSYLQTANVSGSVTDTFMFSVRDSTLKAWPNPGEEGGVRHGEGQPIATDNRFTIQIPEPSTKPCEGLLPEDGLEELKPTFPVNNNEGAPKPVMTIEGGEALITNVNLNYSMISKDGTEETPPSEVLFTVTRLPPNGELQVYDGVKWVEVGKNLIGGHACGEQLNDIKSYGYFTQQNINSNCVRFVHDGSEDHVSSFEFSVGDGGPNRAYGTLGLGAIPVNDRPVARGGELTVIEKAGTQTGIAAITDKQIMATDVDGSEDYPVITDVRGQPVAVRQGGLLAEVYDTGAALSKLSDIEALTHQEPDSFFTATTFSYTDHGRHTLSDFLGVEDSHTLFGNPDAHLHTMAFRFSGYIDLKAGDHHFSVGSDDGFVLRVGGRDISRYDGNRPYSRDNKGSGDFHVDRDGLYPVELIYWENGGKAKLDVELEGQSINPDILFKPSAAVEPEGQDIYQSLTDVDGRSISVCRGGLLGEVFDTGGSLLGDWIETLASLNSIASAERLMSEPPDGVFKASSFHYTDQGRHNLQDFLGTTDAQSLRGGNKQAALTTMAFHFRGYIDLFAGEHQFDIGSDDGFRLNIDGQTVSQHDGNRAYAKSQGTFTAAKAGLYPIDLVYWENGGDARLTVEMDGKALDPDRLHALPFPVEQKGRDTDSVGYIEGLPDDLWFKIRDLPRQGVLEYWDGSAWAAVTTTQWFSAERVKTAAGGYDSGLRYRHSGKDQPVNLSDSFVFDVRDDLGKPVTPFDVRDSISPPSSSHLSNPATVTIWVAPWNDPPLIPTTPDAPDINGQDMFGQDATAINHTLVLAEGETGVISAQQHLHAIDSDNNENQLRYRLRESVSHGQLMRGSRVLEAGDVFTQADINRGLISYKHDGNEDHRDQFRFVVSDGLAESPLSTFAIDIIPRNDFVTLNAPKQVDGRGSATIDLRGKILVEDVDLAAIDTGETDQLTLFLRLTLKGESALYDEANLHLDKPAGLFLFERGNDSPSIGMTGTLADIQTALGSLILRIDDTAGDRGDKDAILQLHVTADDRLYQNGELVQPDQMANGGRVNENGTPVNESNNTVSRAIDILVSTENDPPVITAPQQISAREDEPFTFTGDNAVSISDPDAFGSAVNVTLTVEHGKLKVEGHHDSAIALSDSLSKINRLLANLEYQGNQDYNGPDQLTIVVDDQGYHGDQPAKTDSQTIAIDVIPVNDPPVLAVPGVQTLGTSTSLIFSPANGNPITVDEPADKPYPSFTDQIEVTLTLDDASGQLNLSASSGVTITDGAEGTAAMTFRGTLAKANAALNGLRYTPSAANLDRTVILTVNVDDLDNGQNNPLRVVSDQILINVSAVNDPAWVTVADEKVTINEDSPWGPLTTITVFDVDDFGGEMALTIHAASGALKVDSAYASMVTETAPYLITLTGTKDNINKALTTLQYRPAPNLHAALNVRLIVDDKGHTGLPGEASKEVSFVIDVRSVNDAPVASGSAQIPAVLEDTQAANIYGSSLISLLRGNYDDAVDDWFPQMHATPLTYVAFIGNLSNAQQGTWQVGDGAGRWLDIPAGLNNQQAFLARSDHLLRFVPATDFHGVPGHLEVRLGDGSVPDLAMSTASSDLKNPETTGGVGRTGVWSVSVVTIDTRVTSVNDRPSAASGARLAAVAEDHKNPPGERVDNLFRPVYSDDIDNQTAIAGGEKADTPMGGIAVVGNAATPSEGLWQYTTGSGWQTIPVVSDQQAQLLPNEAKLRFLPATDFNGEPGVLSVRLSDQPVVSNRRDISGALGPTDQWSLLTSLKTKVIAVNDAPVLTGFGGTVIYTEGRDLGVPVILASSGAVSDVELILRGEDDFESATLVVQRAGGANSQDQFDFDFTGKGLVLSGLQIVESTAGAVADVTNNRGGRLAIEFLKPANKAIVDKIIQSITFANTDDSLAAGMTQNIAINFHFDDGNDPAALPQGTGVRETTVSVTVRMVGTNDPPIARDDVNTCTADSALAVEFHEGVLVNDSDPDIGDQLSVISVAGRDMSGQAVSVNEGQLVKGDNGGFFVINADGSYQFDPVGDFSYLSKGESAETAVIYTISDSQGLNAQASLTITVTMGDKPPDPPHPFGKVIAIDNLGTVTRDRVLSAIGNVITDDDGFGVDIGSGRLHVFEVNNCSLCIGQFIQGDYGRLKVTWNGDYVYELDNDSADVRAMLPGQRYTDQFTYTAGLSVGHSSVRDQAMLTISVIVPQDPYIPPYEKPTPVTPDRPDRDQENPFGQETAVIPGIGITLLRFPEDPRLNPLRLSALLPDQLVTEHLYRFAIPSGAFEHTDRSQQVRLEASLADGSGLPDYIQFDSENGVFVVNADAARALGVDHLDILVRGRDQTGNEAATTFAISFMQQAEAPAAADVETLDDLEAPAAGNPDDSSSAEERNSDLDKMHFPGDASYTPPSGSSFHGAGLDQQLRQAVMTTGFVFQRDQLLAHLSAGE